MGFFLSTISDELNLLAQPLHRYSHPFAKVREYHGIFKSECTDFLINQTQYEHIFSNKDDLALWGNNKTANALQLFSGLTFYAQDCSFKSKVRFLFMLFDFNEIKSISIVDLEYMLLSICDFTYKVLGKINTKTDQIKLAQWLAKYLNPRKRVTVTRLYRLCAQAQQIWRFLYIAGATKSELQSAELTNIQQTNLEQKKQKFEQEEIESKINWFSNLCNRLTKPKYKEQAKTNPYLSWVYGIEIDAFKNAFIAIQGPVLLYAVSNKMVVFNAPNRHQLIYDQHAREITSFCIRRSDKIVASAEGKQLPHIYIWNYQTLQTIFIIRLDYSPKIKLMSMSEHQPILAVIGERQNSPILLIQTISWNIVSSLRLLEPANQLQPFTTVIPNTSNELQGCFVISGPTTLVIVDQQGERQSTKYKNEITSLAVCQLNSDYPYLRLFSAQKLCLFVVTGHKNGSIIVWQYYPQSYGQDNTELEKYQILNLTHEIIQLIITPEALFVCTSHQMFIYNLSILINNIENREELQLPRSLKLNDLEQLRLMSKTIHNFSVTEDQICILSKLGDLIVINDRQVVFNGESFKENEGAYRVPNLVKFDKEMRAICFLEKQLHNILLVVSGANQLMQIDPETHEIDLVLTIKVDDFVNVIDSAVIQEGTGVIVCGCRSGKLIIRNDWEQIGKVIDCGSEVSDLKISPQGSALLVATTNTLLLFHLSTTISSPRKLQFYNETPLTLNFLDNSKFCAVSTSARNVYLIELPALKHRSVFKEVQNFAASQLFISYPRGSDASGLACPNLVGGDMKFYIFCLQSGGLLYFPSMSSLQRRNYLLLDGHCSPISNIATNQDQTRFFTLGHQDSLLLQWSVQPIQTTQAKYVKSIERSGQSRFDSEHYFKKIKKISEAPPQAFDYSLSTFFVKGTKSRKLNRRLRYDLNLRLQNYSSEQLALSKRHCNYNIKTNIIYGLQNAKINQIRYTNRNHEDSTMVYSASRFLIEYNKKEPTQKILQYGSKKVAYLDLNDTGQVVWAEYGQKPWIWVGGKRVIQSTHQHGLLHFSLYKDFILSYGLQNKSFTINLHNIRNRKLIAERTTDRKISSFLMINEKEFVSFTEVRRWNNFVISEIHGFASAATILPNGRDICLGGFGGQLSVLCENAVVEVARQAHNKQITVMKTNQRDGHYELITASQDETIKIWNEYFQQLFAIDLKIQDDFTLLIDGDGDAAKYLNLSVCSLDCKGEKILVGFSHGQIWEFVVSTQVQNVSDQQFGSSVSLKSDTSQNYIDKCKSFATERKLLSYKVETNKIIDAHTSNRSQDESYICFDVHSTLPLLATSGNDGRLIITNYEKNEVLANYLCGQKNKVTAIRFSPKGRMLVVGISGGNIITFFVNALQDHNQKILQLNLQTFQTFKSLEKLQIIQIQFDSTGEYFSVSYWKQPRKGSNLEIDSGHLKVFRIKSQKNHNVDQAFYQQKQTIQARLQDKVGNGLSKLVLHMHWKNINDKHYILLYSEYIDSHRKPKNNGKYEIYCLEEKSYLSDEFVIEWIHFNFANLINVKTVGADGQTNPQKYSFTAMYSEQKQEQKLVICGGIDGRLHLLQKEMLHNQSEEIEDKEENMCLSRVYNSHSSFISRIHIAKGSQQNKKYVFVTAHGDETLVQYQLIKQDPELFLQHQVYPRQIIDSQVLNECPSKQHFYLMLNNRQPLRQQLTSVVEDVEKKSNREIALKPERIFGRRAFDRRYNLAFYKNNALYSVGPNIIIQSLTRNQSQQPMKADPSPLSHYPQISSFHYQGKCLAITTEQERGMLYVWDISSRSCLSAIQLECSIVLMIRFCGEENIVLYGFNDRYETVVMLLNWRTKTTIGRSRMVHSGNWIIRDISTVQHKGNNLEFITCGNLHLCYWQLRGDSLVYNNFNSQHKAAYVCVRNINHYIVSGCEKGQLYLWFNFQLVHILKDTHQAAVCCLEVDTNNDILISGGKDGVIFFMKIEENKFTVINRVQLCKPMDVSQSQSWAERAWKVQYQIQSIALSAQPLNEQYQKILMGTRSGAIYSIEYHEQELQAKVKLICEGHDHQNIIGGAFSTQDKNCFFTLSNAGVINKWNITQLSKVFSFDLGRRALKIQSYGSRLLVCCRNEIAVYRVQAKTLSREQQLCIDTRRGDNQASQTRQSEIIRMCFSSSGKILAVCIKICTKQPLYQINIYQFGQSKEPVHITYNLKHQIDYIDFSTDDKYLLFKDRYEEIGMLTLYNKEYKRINTIFVEMNIEWQEEGLRISPHAQKIYYSYSCQNKITAITKLGPNKIIIGDQMGTIRLFDYPCPDERLGQLHLQCYSNHMNDIHFIRTHPHLTHILTSALQDRSLILWKVVQNPKEEILNYL